MALLRCWLLLVLATLAPTRLHIAGQSSILEGNLRMSGKHVLMLVVPLTFIIH
jgi:hypothetical protein